MKAEALASPAAALSWFMDKVIPILEILVPLKCPRKKTRSRIARQRKLLWRRLGKIQKKIESSSSVTRLSKLLQDKWDLEMQLKSEYTSLNAKKENDAILNLKENPKSFFSFARSRQKTRARIGPFIDSSSGKPNPDPDFAASVLSEQYNSVFVQGRPEWHVENAKEFFSQSCADVPSLSEIKFSEMDIEMACHDLNPSSAAGADGVPASLLKTCRKELKKPLFILWQASLQQGVIPADLLLVLVSPVHKGGGRGAAKNYRPVALTSHLIKVFERVLRRSVAKNYHNINQMAIT